MLDTNIWNGCGATVFVTHTQDWEFAREVHRGSEVIDRTNVELVITTPLTVRAGVRIRVVCIQLQRQIIGCIPLNIKAGRFEVRFGQVVFDDAVDFVQAGIFGVGQRIRRVGITPLDIDIASTGKPETGTKLIGFVFLLYVQVIRRQGQCFYWLILHRQLAVKTFAVNFINGVHHF